MNSTNFHTVGSNKRQADRVVSETQNQIIEGKLPPGTKLPPAKKGYKRILGPANTDGLCDRELIYLYKSQFPVVLIHQSPPAGIPIPVVTVENKKSVYLLFGHLITVHGYQRIAYLPGVRTRRWPL